MGYHISLVGRKNLSLEIYRQLRDAMLNGLLGPGEALLASRELARTLNVSRMTVIVAYDRLTAEGFTTTRIGSGTFVNPHLARAQDKKISSNASPLKPRPIWNSINLPSAFTHPVIYDFRTGMPDGALFPHRIWRRLMNRALRVQEKSPAVYGHPGGHPQLLEAIAWQVGRSRGVAAAAEDVTITNGTQQALDILMRVLIEPGDFVAMEDPGYPALRQLFESAGARVIPVPVDGEGIVIEKIPKKVRAIYVTPSHQYPLGFPMSLARRQALLAWAEKHAAAIIEDDYDSEFRYAGRPLDPLRTLDKSGRVIYVGSFSKSLLPSLRLGFIIAPRSLQAAIHKAKFVSDWHSPTLTQMALAQFIKEGGFANHIRRANLVYQRRHALVTKILARDFAGHLELIPSTTGLHVTAFTRKISAEQLATIERRAFEIGVALHQSSWLTSKPAKRPFVVLGYGRIPVNRIDEGLRHLRSCFRN